MPEEIRPSVPKNFLPGIRNEQAAYFIVFTILAAGLASVSLLSTYPTDFKNWVANHHIEIIIGSSLLALASLRVFSVYCDNRKLTAFDVNQTASRQESESLTLTATNHEGNIVKLTLLPQKDDLVTIHYPIANKKTNIIVYNDYRVLASHDGQLIEIDEFGTLLTVNKKGHFFLYDTQRATYHAIATPQLRLNESGQLIVCKQNENTQIKIDANGELAELNFTPSSPIPALMPESIVKALNFEKKAEIILNTKKIDEDIVVCFENTPIKIGKNRSELVIQNNAYYFKNGVVLTQIGEVKDLEIGKKKDEWIIYDPKTNKFFEDSENGSIIAVSLR